MLDDSHHILETRIPLGCHPPASVSCFGKILHGSRQRASSRNPVSRVSYMQGCEAAFCDPPGVQPADRSPKTRGLGAHGLGRGNTRSGFESCCPALTPHWPIIHAVVSSPTATSQLPAEQTSPAQEGGSIVAHAPGSH